MRLSLRPRSREWDQMGDQQGFQVGASRCVSGGHDLTQFCSLSTLHREYAALVALPYYDLSDVIFNPKLTKVAIDKREVRASMEKYGVNEPQAGAIVGALNTEGFSLIQG